MRLAHTVSHAIQEGTTNVTVFTRGGVAAYETITEHTEYVMALADDDEGIELEKGGVTTIKTLLISSDKDILVMLGATDHEPISVKANFPLALVMRTGVTAVFVTNDSGDDTILTVVVGG